MNTSPWRWVLLAWVLSAVGGATAQEVAPTKTWSSSADMDWFNPNNWTPVGVPGNGDAVLIQSGTNVLLTNSTAIGLAQLVISNRTLICSNWSTVLYATNIFLRSNGRIGLPSYFTDVQMSNRIFLVCSNLTLDAGSRLDAAGKGFKGGDNTDGYGAGKGYRRAGGAGHGGRGGDPGGGMSGNGGGVYGVAASPEAPGSGGGGDSVAGRLAGAGGGAIRIEASGTVTINGLVDANGLVGAAYNGGGSGGSIWITCHTLAGGASGVVRVNGGAGITDGGAGGGGRIAVDYTILSGAPAIQFEAKVGGSDPYATWLRHVILPSKWGADAGTIWFSRTNLFGTVMSQFDGHLQSPGWTEWAPESLTVSGRLVRLPDDFKLTVAGDLLVHSNGVLQIKGRPTVSVAGHATLNNGQWVLNVCTQLSCGADLVLTNGGKLWLMSGPTNSATTNYGGLVTVGGALWLGSSSWIYPFSDGTNGGSILFRVNRLTVNDSSSGFSASDGGLLGNYDAVAGNGPGKGPSARRGAGYEGAGGMYSGGAGGARYGVTNAPILMGSSGGGSSGRYGGAGGGVVWVESAGPIILNGHVRANGSADAYVGGGSGGAILLAGTTFEGASGGRLEAKGATGLTDGAGGGGGRIAVITGLTSGEVAQLIAGQTVGGLAVFTNNNLFLGQLRVEGGTGVGSGSNGAPGSAVFVGKGYVLTVTGVPDLYGDPSPANYGQTTMPVDGWITNAVESPADSSGGVRRACIGWALEAEGVGLVGGGDTTQAVFQATTNMTLTWRWTNEYQVTFSSGPNGTATTNANGWYTNGLTAGSTPTPSNDYVFYKWLGDVPTNQSFDDPLTVAMTQPRVIEASFRSVTSEVKVWRGTGRWTTATNWTPVGMPGAIDRAILATGTVVLATAERVASLVISNGATLMCSNWTSGLTVDGNVLMNSNGFIRTPAAFAEGVPSNRIVLICGGNLTILPGSAINADAGGYVGRELADGYGPGRGGRRMGGAGHGGAGGNSSVGYAGVAYGNSNAPTAPGSSGGSDSVAGRVAGSGGGAIQVEVAGTVALDGMLTANGGTAGAYTGGGSGGSIYLMCAELTGNGTLRARGSDGNTTAGAGGGGGRIAVWVSVSPAIRAAFLSGTVFGNLRVGTNSPPTFTGTVSVTNGLAYGGANYQNGAPGTALFMTYVGAKGTIFIVR